jgi:hypothetical protein
VFDEVQHDHCLSFLELSLGGVLTVRRFSGLRRARKADVSLRRIDPL